MSYLSKMYKSMSPAKTVVDKNPNRVLGGLRGQGVDHYSVLGEDGMERKVPTQAYVNGLEEKIKQQDVRLAVLEKNQRRISNDQKLDRQAFSRTLNR